MSARSFGDATALPDIDGDGVMDYAVGDSAADSATAGIDAGRVEIRSGSSDALLQSFDGASQGEYLGAVLAAGVQPATNGTAETPQILAVTLFESYGRAEVRDAASGALVFEVRSSVPNEWYGSQASWVGDVDGDGVGDWAITTGALSSPKVVRLMSGFDGSTIRELQRHVGVAAFDASIASGADFDGDGVADLVLGSPDYFNFSGGTVDVVSSLDGSTLLSIGPSDPGDTLFGIRAVLLGDVNGDGVPDLAATGATGAYSAFSGFVEVRSGKDGAVLARFDAPFLGAQEYWMAPAGAAAWELLGAATGSTRVTSGQSVNGDAIPDLALGVAFDDVGGEDAGSVSMRFLDDLLLQVAPAAPSAGDTLTATTRGGVANQLAGLWLVAVDGTATVTRVDLGMLDPFGVRTFSAIVPSGLAGHVLSLRAWSIGFSGRVTDSQVVEIAFL